MSDERKTREIERAEHGRFAKGTPSPNPSGRPKADAEVVELARDLAPGAMRRLWDIANDPRKNAQAQVKALEIIIDRAYGRPAQAVDVTGMGIQVTTFQLVAGKPPEELQAGADEIEGEVVEG